MSFSSVFLSLAVGLALDATTTASQQRPNIVIVLADNMGCYGGYRKK